MALSSRVDSADLAWGHAHPGPLLILVQLVVYHHLRLCLLKLHVVVPDIGLQQRRLLQVAESQAIARTAIFKTYRLAHLVLVPCVVLLTHLNLEGTRKRPFSRCDKALLQNPASAAQVKPY